MGAAGSAPHAQRTQAVLTCGISGRAGSSGRSSASVAPAGGVRGGGESAAR